MNKRMQRKLDVFKRVQARKPAYCFSQYTPHEQAIREHVARGFVDPRRRGVLDELALLDQRNKI